MLTDVVAIVGEGVGGGGGGATYTYIYGAVRRMEHNRAAVEPHRAAVAPRRAPVVAAHTEHSVHMRCGKGGKKEMENNPNIQKTNQNVKGQPPIRVLRETT